MCQQKEVNMLEQINETLTAAGVFIGAIAALIEATRRSRESKKRKRTKKKQKH
ncbi:Uncharacterised protein [Chlamydia trachomatis]|nr:Uncharacterised protein [Chlamydia trachomatis]